MENLQLSKRDKLSPRAGFKGDFSILLKKIYK